VNWKGVGRKRSWPNRGNIPEFSWRDWGVKPRITPVKIAGAPAEIRSEYFPNTGVGRFLQTILLGIKVMKIFRAYNCTGYAASNSTYAVNWKACEKKPGLINETTNNFKPGHPVSGPSSETPEYEAAA
jgi:hypothetical protein